MLANLVCFLLNSLVEELDHFTIKETFRYTKWWSYLGGFIVCMSYLPSKGDKRVPVVHNGNFLYLSDSTLCSELKLGVFGVLWAAEVCDAILSIESNPVLCIGPQAS